MHRVKGTTILCISSQRKSQTFDPAQKRQAVGRDIPYLSAPCDSGWRMLRRGILCRRRLRCERSGRCWSALWRRCLLAALCADDSVGDGSAVDLAARVKRLEQRQERISKERARILQHGAELRQSYKAIQLDLQRLQAIAVLRAIQSVEAQVSRDDGAAGRRIHFGKSRRPSPNADRYNVRFATALGHAAVQYEAQRLAINDQLRQMDAASRLAAELLKVIEQLVDVAKATESLQKEFDQSQQEYWLVTDVQGRYSREELHALAERHGAGRDGQSGVSRGAKASLSDVWGTTPRPSKTSTRPSRWGEPDMPVALAAKGESLVANGQRREGFGELTKARRLAKQDGRVTWLYAQALAADGKWAAAESAWKRLLQLGGYDAVAHRGLSLLFGSRPRSGIVTPTTHSNTPDWPARSPEIKSGPVSMHWPSRHAAAGDFGEATAQARRAAELAPGEKREFCLDHARKFESNQRLTWNWKD